MSLPGFRRYWLHTDTDLDWLHGVSYLRIGGFVVVVVVVVVLLFYVHGKHLRSCQDGQVT